MSTEALSRGYHVFIQNPVAPTESVGRTDLECIDFTKNYPVKEAIETLKETFGADVDIYAIGFSLGANHLLRHLGAHKNCQTKCGFKAAISVSGAFDLPTTGIELKYSLFGLYDQFMLRMIRSHFFEKKFKYQNEVHDLVHIGR